MNTRKTATRKTLWFLLFILLGATAMVFGTSLWMFQKVYDTVELVHNRTAPAIMEVLATKEALVEADTAALTSFKSNNTELAEPGQQYQNQLTLASQNLARVAEDNTAGDRSSQTIQLVDGLLVSYSSLIGEANASYRKGSGDTLGLANLWYASLLVGSPPPDANISVLDMLTQFEQLVAGTPPPDPNISVLDMLTQFEQLAAGTPPSDEDGGILTQLDELLDAQTDALNAQISASATTVNLVLTWALPILILFILLGVTQIFLKRRFRRTMNPFLLIATVLLAGLTAATSLALVTQYRLENHRDDLHRLTENWNEQTKSADAQRLGNLTAKMEEKCGNEAGGCGATVTKFTINSPSAGPNIEDAAEQAQKIRDQIAAADSNADLEPLIPILTTLIAVLIIVGLRPRLEEYRYRPR